jgi:hypothetical protein
MLFSLFWNLTVEDATGYNELPFYNWVFMGIHFLTVMSFALVSAGLVPYRPDSSDFDTRRNIYISAALLGPSSLFSYQYFWVIKFISKTVYRQNFMFEIGYSLAAWLGLWIIVLLILHFVFGTKRVGSFRKNQKR